MAVVKFKVRAETKSGVVDLHKISECCDQWFSFPLLSDDWNDWGRRDRDNLLDFSLTHRLSNPRS
jgi:hypothetical protein